MASNVRQLSLADILETLPRLSYKDREVITSTCCAINERTPPRGAVARPAAAPAAPIPVIPANPPTGWVQTSKGRFVKVRGKKPRSAPWKQANAAVQRTARELRDYARTKSLSNEQLLADPTYNKLTTSLNEAKEQFKIVRAREAPASKLAASSLPHQLVEAKND